MTREEAIKAIKSHCYFANLVPAGKEALDMAIEVLEREQCNDAISRQWVLDVVNNFVFDTETDRNRIIHIIRDTAPSVTPKQKAGKWIPVSESLPEVGSEVLVSGYDTYGKRVIISRYQGEQYGFTCGLVSAWKPLPEPYKTESEDI